MQKTFYGDLCEALAEVCEESAAEDEGRARVALWRSLALQRGGESAEAARALAYAQSLLCKAEAIRIEGDEIIRVLQAPTLR